MDALLAHVMQGVDLSSPDAGLLMFQNLMAWVPWWPLLGWTVFSILGGVWIGWKRGRLKQAVLWSLIFGVVAWPILLTLPSRRREQLLTKPDVDVNSN